MQEMSHDAGIKYFKIFYFLLNCYLDPSLFPFIYLFFLLILSSFRLQVLLSRACHSLCDCTVPGTTGSQVVFPLRCFFAQNGETNTGEHFMDLCKESLARLLRALFVCLWGWALQRPFGNQLHSAKVSLKSRSEKTIIPLKIFTHATFS